MPKRSDITTKIERIFEGYNRYKSGNDKNIYWVEDEILKILEGKVIVEEQKLMELAELLNNRIEIANEYGEVAVRDGMTEKKFLESILMEFAEFGVESTKGGDNNDG